MGDRLRLAVIGLPELGHLLEDGKPHGVDVVAIAAGAGVERRLAEAARGATRDSLLCVIADTGDEAVNRLPARLARGGVRSVVLTGLPGASGDVAAHANLRFLAAPFAADDVLAELSALPGDVPFFLPVEGGDRLFGEARGDELRAERRSHELVEVIFGRTGVEDGPAAGDGRDGRGDEAGGADGRDDGQGSDRHGGGGADPLGGYVSGGGGADPLGGYVSGHVSPRPPGALPAWARIPPPPPSPAAQAATPGWLIDAPPAPTLVHDGRVPAGEYVARALHSPPVVAGLPLPPRPVAPAPRRSQVLSVCSYKGGSGKCLTGDAVIVDPVTGLPHRLDDVVHDPRVASVVTVDGDAVRTAPIAAKVDSGVQPTLRVALRSGRSVTATPHHPFLMADGWHRADQLTPGEAVALPARIPFPERPRRLGERALVRLIAGAVAAATGAAPLPRAAFRLPADQLARLVAAVCAAGGAAAGDGPPRVALASEPPARALQHLLLRFGVASAVAPAGPPSDGDRLAPWRVAVHPAGVAGFAALIAGRWVPATPAGGGAEGDLFWDEVESVTPAGRRQVWDLSVEPTRCFVANDVLVHNTTTALLAAGALARAVAPAGKRVALVDANTAQSSISSVVRHPPGGTILDLVRTDVDEHLLAAALTPMPDAGGLDVLFGAPDLRSADGRLVTPTLYRRAVATLRRTHDYVVVDTPVAEAVGHELFDEFVLRDSDRVIVVLDPNRETIQNNVEWLDIIGDPVSAGGRNFPAERIGIVLNRADGEVDWDAEAVGSYFRRYQFLGAVPRAAVVQRAANDGRLLLAFDAAIERAIRRVLANVLDEPALVDAPDVRRSGFERVLGRLFGNR